MILRPSLPRNHSFAVVSVAHSGNFGVVIATIRHDQMIEVLCNHWTTPRITRRGLVGWDDLRLWPAGRNREFPETLRSVSDPVCWFHQGSNECRGAARNEWRNLAIGLYAVEGQVERRVWWEWEARICHCNRRLSAFCKRVCE